MKPASRILRAGMLDIVGRYSFEGDISLEGTQQALSQLAAVVKLAGTYPLVVPEKALVAPYDAFLERLEITFSDPRVRIARRDRSLSISGPKWGLKALSETISWLSQPSSAGQHVHVEYYPDHYYLDASSEPIVVNAVASGSGIR
jgi:hypothetical protein